MTRKTRRQQQVKTNKVVPKSEGQQIYWDALVDDRIKYISCSGLPGTGKTLLSVYRAAQGLISGEYLKIYLSRSITGIPSQDLGHLKGDLVEKFSPWVRQMLTYLDEFLPRNLEHYFSVGEIEILPLYMLRGDNIRQSIVLVTEAQNLEMDAFKCLMTRLDSNSKIIFDGDVEQSDLKGYHNDFETFSNLFDGRLESFERVYLDERDVQRSKDIVQITHIFREYERSKQCTDPYQNS